MKEYYLQERYPFPRTYSWLGIGPKDTREYAEREYNILNFPCEFKMADFARVKENCEIFDENQVIHLYEPAHSEEQSNKMPKNPEIMIIMNK